MSILLTSLSNSGDYLKLLYELLKSSTQIRDEEGNVIRQKAHVFYEHEINPREYDLPVIILCNPSLLDWNWSDDGRMENTFSVSLFVKVPKNDRNPSETAMNITGTICSLMTGQCFDALLENSDDSVEEPQDIQAVPLKWDGNNQGYEVQFEQLVRYGIEDEYSVTWLGLQLNESGGSEIYHDLESSDI